MKFPSRYLTTPLATLLFWTGYQVSHARPHLEWKESELPKQSEVKFRMAPSHTASDVLADLGVTGKKYPRRSILILDAGDTSLQNLDLQLRLRMDEGDPSYEVSVKVRYVLPSEVDAFKDISGLKCELNVTPSTSTPACTLTEERSASTGISTLFFETDGSKLLSLPKDEALRLSENSFSGQQDDFAMELTGASILLIPESQYLRPIQHFSVSRWKISADQLGLESLHSEKLVLEEWLNTKSGLKAIELSWKVPTSIRAAAQKALSDLLRSRGIHFQKNPESRSGAASL